MCMIYLTWVKGSIYIWSYLWIGEYGKFDTQALYFNIIEGIYEVMSSTFLTFSYLGLRAIYICNYLWNNEYGMFDT